MQSFSSAQLTGKVQAGMIDVADMPALHAAGNMPEELQDWWRENYDIVSIVLCRFSLLLRDGRLCPSAIDRSHEPG